MTKSRIAEWILSQVIPPDRAASTVGDWLEDMPKRGKIWFWSCVLRTVLSRVWTDLAESPGFMLSLALRSCLFSWLVYVIGIIVLIPAASILMTLFHLFQFLPWQHSHAAFRFLGELAGWTFGTACGFLTGRWTARRAMGGRMAVCTACCIANLMLSGAISLHSSQFLSSDLKYSLATHAANTPWIVAELIFEVGFIGGFLFLRRPERRVTQ